MKNKIGIWSQLLLIGILLILADSCRKESDSSNNITIQVPVLTTSAIRSITSTTAMCGGNVSSQGSTRITAKGVCWSRGPAPAINNSKTVNGADMGSFSSKLTGLRPNTEYYVRAYATNSAGTGYGNTMKFNTFPPCNTIYYKNFNPDTAFSATANTNLSFYMDVNGDSINEIQIIMKSFFDYWGSHAWWCQYIYMNGQDSLQFITTPYIYLMQLCTASLDTSTYIDSNTPDQSYFYLDAYDPNGGQSCYFNQHGYIGIKLHRNGNDYCGWIHLHAIHENSDDGTASVVIDDLAISTCPNEPIKIGHH